MKRLDLRVTHYGWRRMKVIAPINLIPERGYMSKVRAAATDLLLEPIEK